MSCQQPGRHHVLCRNAPTAVASPEEGQIPTEIVPIEAFAQDIDSFTERVQVGLHSARATALVNICPAPG